MPRPPIVGLSGESRGLCNAARSPTSTESTPRLARYRQADAASRRRGWLREKLNSKYRKKFGDELAQGPLSANQLPGVLLGLEHQHQDLLKQHIVAIY